MKRKEMAYFSLAGRSALITGAASGIGAATARVFALAGADLALAWYPPDGHDIEPIRRDAETAGAAVVVDEVDVRKQADIDRLVGHAVEAFGTSTSWSPTLGLPGLSLSPKRSTSGI